MVVFYEVMITSSDDIDNIKYEQENTTKLLTNWMELFSMVLSENSNS